MIMVWTKEKRADLQALGRHHPMYPRVPRFQCTASCQTAAADMTLIHAAWHEADQWWQGR